jgi:hypothetical protein
MNLSAEPGKRITGKGSLFPVMSSEFHRIPCYLVFPSMRRAVFSSPFFAERGNERRNREPPTLTLAT